MQPRVLISAPKDGGKNYLAAVRAAGGEAAAIYCPDPDLRYDALLLSGGGDMLPSYYGEACTASTGLDPARDAAELALFHAYWQAGKPIFGICRGMQLINVALGGKLLQDIGDALRPAHSACAGQDRLHRISQPKDSFLGRLWGETCVVNSSHHQVVSTLGEGLRCVSRAEDGLPEALVHESRPLYAVQFHPERLTGPGAPEGAADGGALFAWLIGLCRGGGL